MLNGSYGKSGSEHSFFFDKKFMLSITLTGQLSLTMLAEEIQDTLDCKILQCNTDGVTIRIKRTDYNVLTDICKRWEKLTKLELEYANYDAMHIRDVNNYLSEYEPFEVTQEEWIKHQDKHDYVCILDGERYLLRKLKLKGCFEIERAWNKNHSMRIVPIALKEYFVNKVPIEDTIKSSREIYDFCLGSKTKRTWTSVLRFVEGHGVGEKKLQKTNRYFISKKGSSLIRRCDDGRETNVQRGFNVTIFNDYFSKEIFHEYNINYAYYTNESRKIIRNVEGISQLTLF